MKLKLRKSVSRFADWMEFRLRKNDHKLGWSGDQNLMLHLRLMEEARELRKAITENAPAMVIAHEAADVANFAMMIADNAGALKPDYPFTFGDLPPPKKGKTMTLDQLIEAAQNPTPEIVGEVCKRVHEIATLCGNDHKWYKAYVTPGMTHYNCLVCGSHVAVPIGIPPPTIEDVGIPDYTKAENFWPLIEEYETGGVRKVGKKYVAFLRRWIGENCYFSNCEAPGAGIAVCLAYLKIKEQENG